MADQLPANRKPSPRPLFAKLLKPILADGREPKAAARLTARRGTSWYGDDSIPSGSALRSLAGRPDSLANGAEVFSHWIRHDARSRARRTDLRPVCHVGSVLVPGRRVCRIRNGLKRRASSRACDEEDQVRVFDLECAQHLIHQELRVGDDFNSRGPSSRATSEHQ